MSRLWRLERGAAVGAAGPGAGRQSANRSTARRRVRGRKPGEAARVSGSGPGPPGGPGTGRSTASGQPDWSFTSAAGPINQTSSWRRTGRFAGPQAGRNGSLGQPRGGGSRNSTLEDEGWARPPCPLDSDHVALVADRRTVVMFDLTRGVNSWVFRESRKCPERPPRLFGGASDSSRSRRQRTHPARRGGRGMTVASPSAWKTWGTVRGLAADGDRASTEPPDAQRRATERRLASLEPLHGGPDGVGPWT